MEIENFLKAAEKTVLDEHFIYCTTSNFGEVMQFTGCAMMVVGSDFAIGGLRCRLITLTGYYEFPSGTWIVKLPDGRIYPVGPFVTFTEDADEAIKVDEPEENGPITTFVPEDMFENEVVFEGNSTSLRRKLDKDGNPILKKKAYDKFGSHYELFKREMDKYTTKK